MAHPNFYVLATGSVWDMDLEGKVGAYFYLVEKILYCDCDAVVVPSAMDQEHTNQELEARKCIVTASYGLTTLLAHNTLSSKKKQQ